MYCTPTSGAASSIGTSSEGIGWQKRRDLYAVCGVATAVQQPVFVPASDGESRFVPPAAAAGGGAGVSGAVGAGGRNRLVEHNLRLVAHIIKKYYTQADNQEDLISIGTIGLIKAVNTFRADRGIKLATYASRCIENEILMYFRSQRKLQGEVSLSDAIDTDKEGGSLYLLDVVGADDTMLSDLQDREEQLLLRRLVRDCLTEREADIIRRRYGLEGHPPQTQRQVAAVYGISRSYVSRIEKRALEKLEKELRKG